jgi:succinate dehydrogenase / fumarate reductase cytochrome b subunit
MHFVMRRLHSLTGIVPVGIFVIFHLMTNFQLLAGDFEHEVGFIHSLPFLIVIEVSLWLGIGFHAGLGLVYTFSGAKPNASAYRNSSNYRYTLQRITGIIALIFIFFHVATLRWRWDFFGWYTPFYGTGPNGEPLAAATTAAAIQASWLIAVFYLVGSLSIVFHWVNGLWTAAITWGLTISVKAQKMWGKLCLGLGILLTVFTIGAIAGALMHEVTDADRLLIQQMSTGAASPQHGSTVPVSVPVSAPASHAK